MSKSLIAPEALCAGAPAGTRCAGGEEDDLSFRSGATSIDYRETAKTSGVTQSGKTAQRRRLVYRFEMESPDGQGGTLGTSNRFARDDARLRWTNTYGGISTTVTICRHG